MSSGGTAASGAITTSTIGSKTSYPIWEYYLLKAIGAPANEAQLKALNLWSRIEGMPGSTNNWLAITDPNNEFGPESSTWNSVGVAVFSSLSSGIGATAKFLENGHDGVLEALRDPNATIQSIGQAVASDGAWGGDGSFIASNGNTILADEIYTNGSSTGTNNASTDSSFTQCNSANGLIKFDYGLGTANILNPCQAKAIVGGLIVGAGTLIMVGGVILITSGAVKQLGIKDVAGAIAGALGDAQKKIIGRSTKPVPAAPAKGPAPRQDESVEQARRNWEKKYGKPWSESKAGQAAARAS